MILRRIWVAAICLSVWASGPGLADLAKGFVAPPPDARAMMRWWWFGPSVTKAELERELKAMKAGGLGGVEIQPVYPLSLDNPEKGIRNLPFLSPEFMEALRFAAEKGRELGLRVDLTLGSGWPYGGPHISKELAAPRLRVEKLGSAPRLREAEKVLAEYPESGLRFIEGHTGQMVKRASAGAEGFVLDHYNRAALDAHLQAVGEPLLKAFGPTPPYAIFCDSLEVFGSDWTGDLLAEFQRRRGYDLKPLLPALAGELDEAKGAIRNDYALTLTELGEERFLKPLQQWAHAHGTKLRAQTYGTPPVTLSSMRYVDLADGEQTQWKRLSVARWAASANHLLGRDVTSSETWTWLHSPTFAATPLDVKAEADVHFVQGVNQLIGHGWPYSPPSAGRPGWGFYAAGVFNDSNPWWNVMPDLALYLQRVSYLMRQGQPVADVALYLPVADIRARFNAGNGRVSTDRQAHEVLGEFVIPQLLANGFNFDMIDDGLLDQAFARNYKAIILPHVERIPLATLRGLEQFSAKGGILLAVGRRPALAPGRENAKATAAEVSALSARLFANGKANFIADDRELGAKLSALLKPGATWAPASDALAYAQRRTPDADIFFFANTANTPYSGHLSFTKDLNAQLWDPLTGRRSAFNGTLDLPAYGSAVIVRSTAAAPPPENKPDKKTLDIGSGWKVSFSSGVTQTMTQLRSWTESPETRFFSGTATYEKQVTLTPDLVNATLDFGPSTPLRSGSPRQSGMRAWLAGPVRDAAVVFVNGKRAGAVFAPPYRIDLSGHLKPGNNTLRIEVANTSLNLLAQKGEPDFRDVAAKYGERFQMQDMKHMAPEPSGLLGPLTLRAR